MRPFSSSVAILISAILLASCLLTVASDSTSSSSSSSPSSSSSSSGATSHSGHSKHSSTATQPRQSGISAAASLVGALGSLVPGLISNVAPLVVLLGLGALMMPALGMSAMGLLREARRSNLQLLQGRQRHQLALGAAPSASFSAGGINGSDQVQPPGLGPLPAAFAQYARPLQGGPQDIYYFTKRSLPAGLLSAVSSHEIVAGLEGLAGRIARALDNADQRYN